MAPIYVVRYTEPEQNEVPMITYFYPYCWYTTPSVFTRENRDAFASEFEDMWMPKKHNWPFRLMRAVRGF